MARSKPENHEPADLCSLRLTPAEREVLKAFACFDTSREIAERLFVTRATVKWHTRSLFRKLGVRSRAHAIGRALRCGLLTAEELGALPAPKDSPFGEFPDTLSDPYH